MDPFVLLKRDHKRVSSCFDELFTASNISRKKDLFSYLKQELKGHMKLEEKYFHPLMKKDKSAKKALALAREEFNEIRVLFNRLSRTRKSDDHWADLIAKLYETVKRHVRDDRRTFIRVENLLNYNQQQEMGDRMIGKKKMRFKGFWQRLRKWF